MDCDFRKLNDREMGLLERLLEDDFPGRDELRTQLPAITAKQIEPDGTLALRCHGGRPAQSKYRVANEAICEDSDGAMIAVVLHLNADGFMTMLEIIKYDGSAILRPPSGRDLQLLPR
jgi:hypothetical protein